MKNPGYNLSKYPETIYRQVSPFCHHDSIIYLQFGHKVNRFLSVSGNTNQSWDDCLGRIPLESGSFTSTVLAAGSRIAILSLSDRSSNILVYSSTLEQSSRILHPERVLKMQLNSLGDLPVTYGYLTTRVWSLPSGHCVTEVRNPESRPRPQSMILLEDSSGILAACDDRRV